jgi:hypothetical protein
VITADLGLFLAHRVGIQEGPSLCALKLAADLVSSPEGTHQLTEEDLRAHATAKATAEAHRAEARKNSPRRPRAAVQAHEQSPWRNSRP